MVNKWVSEPLGAEGAEIDLTEIHGTRFEDYSVISSNPMTRVQLAVPWGQKELAVTELCGKPQKWPYFSIFDAGPPDSGDLRVVSVSVATDAGEGAVDANGELIDYNYFAILNVTYMVRKGVYKYFTSPAEEFYVEDEIQQRYESRPMEHTQLIWSDKNGNTPVEAKRRQLAPNEVPVKFETGDTLVHIIEGWTNPLSTIAKVSTCNEHEYFSPLLNKTFSTKTLLLRSIQQLRGFNFKTYRTGFATTTLRLQYEYKEDGWNKFWRTDIDEAGAAFQYYTTIRRNADPFGVIDPFPVVDHRAYLFAF